MTLTACEISGHVQTMAYMILTTILVYRTCDMYSSFSSINGGDKVAESLKYAASGGSLACNPAYQNFQASL